MGMGLGLQIDLLEYLLGLDLFGIDDFLSLLYFLKKCPINFIKKYPWENLSHFLIFGVFGVLGVFGVSGHV